MASDPNSSWGSAAPPVEGEGDTLSNAQRSTLKWEKEEALGAMATVAPVLYTNINFPGLKDEFPGEWGTAPPSPVGRRLSLSVWARLPAVESPQGMFTQGGRAAGSAPGPRETSSSVPGPGPRAASPRAQLNGGMTWCSVLGTSQTCGSQCCAVCGAVRVEHVPRTELEVSSQLCPPQF